jgi:UDP-N-acetyl-2-amino-2-deoxyglucuronate dehydrogenase
MKKKIKISFIGLGRVFEHYLYILKKFKMHKNFAIHSLCDENVNKIIKYKKKIKTNYFDNLDSFLNFKEKPDYTFILTPSGLHFEHGIKCLKANMNVVIEKPIAMLISQAEKLIALAKKKNKFLGVVFQNRYNKAILKTKEILSKNKLGKLSTFSVRLIWCRFQEYYNDDWHGKWKSDGGVLNQQAIHHLDAMNWLLGPVKEVVCSCSNSLNKLQAEDTAVSLIKMKSGLIGTFQATTAARPKDIMAEISIYGEKGSITIGGIALNKFVNIDIFKNSKKIKINKNKFFDNVKNGYGFSHGNLLNNLIYKNKKMLVNAIDGLNNVILVHSLYKSNEKKRWIAPSKKNYSQKLGK